MTKRCSFAFLRTSPVLVILTLLFIAFSRPSYGEEIDQFSHRLFMVKNLKDSLLVEGNPLDKEMNQILKEMLVKINSRDFITEKAKTRITRVAFQHILMEALITPYSIWMVNEAKIHLFRSEGRGIYGDEVTFEDMYMAWFVNLSPVVNVGGVIQGTDKIGHFIAQGWQYFQYYKQLKDAPNEVAIKSKILKGPGERDRGKDKNRKFKSPFAKKPAPRYTEKELLVKLREYGHIQEMGDLGLGSGGVYSYADLASNWEGFLFFKYLFDGPPGKTYFKKNDSGKYDLVRKFTWKDYMTDDWDEVIAPSRINDPIFYRKLVTNFKKPFEASGKSICDQYGKNPKKFFNRIGKTIPKADYVWKKAEAFFKGTDFYLDIKKLCL